jgi:hypothetical protein
MSCRASAGQHYRTTLTNARPTSARDNGGVESSGGLRPGRGDADAPGGLVVKQGSGCLRAARLSIRNAASAS